MSLGQTHLNRTLRRLLRHSSTTNVDYKRRQPPASATRFLQARGFMICCIFSYFFPTLKLSIFIMMCNTLVVLISTLLSTSTALVLPAQIKPFPPGSSAEPVNVQDKCTFTLWHKQVYRSSVKMNYIQINELVDHPNNLVIDIASYRPAAAHNSYNRVSERQVFAIEGLLDNRNLTIRGKDGSDVLTFEYDGLTGSSDPFVRNNGDDAICYAGPWDTEPWNTESTSRVSSKFTCSPMSLVADIR